MEIGIKDIVARCGGRKVLAAAFDISGAAVSQWRRVPAKRCMQVAVLSGLPAHTLRPDIFASQDELTDSSRAPSSALFCPATKS